MVKWLHVLQLCRLTGVTTFIKSLPLHPIYQQSRWDLKLIGFYRLLCFKTFYLCRNKKP